MTDLTKHPVLSAIESLHGQSADGSSKVISASAVARACGLPLKEVKRILTMNDGALAKNTKGNLTGLRLTAFASERGLVIHKRRFVRGSRYFCQFHFKGKNVGSFDLDTADGPERAKTAETTLKEQHRVPVCSNMRDLPEDVFRMIWKERDFHDPAAEHVHDHSDPAEPTHRP